MKKHNVVVYETREEIDEKLGMEEVYKVIEIDEETMILFFDTDDIEIWNTNDSKIVKFCHDVYDKEDDETTTYKYLEEFFLEEYL